MRVVFMGSPDFAVPVLAALVNGGLDVVAVYSRPDRPSGRGRRLTPPPVKSYAEAAGIPVYQPQSLRRRSAVEGVRELEPDMVVVAAYGRILPTDVLALPPKGIVNVHPSLLPKYRGPSPTITAILDGCTRTGVSLMALDEGMDTGPVLAQRMVEILPGETAKDLNERLFEKGAQLLVETLPRWLAGDVVPWPQDDSKASVTRMYSKGDGEIDWSGSAEYLARMLRAFHPWPGCYTRWEGKLLKVLAGSAVRDPVVTPRNSGRVVEVRLPAGDALCVATGDGLFTLARVQLEGKRPQEVGEFVRGYPSFIGTRLPS